MAPVWIVATFVPKSGKAKRLEEILENMSQNVKTKEAGCPQYQMLRELDATPPRIVMIEKYNSKEDQEKHMQTDHFNAVFKAFGNDDVLAKDGEIVVLEHAGGYESK